MALGVSENQDEIRYLVESKENVADFPDDGPFADRSGSW
jgi:hypothetical protein